MMLESCSAACSDIAVMELDVHQPLHRLKVHLIILKACHYVFESSHEIKWCSLNKH